MPATASGTIQGLRARYANVLVLNEGHLYQILSWTIDDRPESFEALHELERSFRFLEGPVRGRSVAKEAKDDYGVGWRVREGVFESPAYRLRVQPKENWRLLTGSELENINPDAEVGLQNTANETYVLVIPELAPRQEAEPFLDYLDSVFSANMGVEHEAEAKLAIGGDTRDFRRYRADFGVELVYWHEAWFEGPFCYQVTGWRAPVEDAQDLAAVQEGLSCIEVIGAEEANRLGDELRQLPDKEGQVGPDFALRGGRYRNYSFGFEWKKPASGFWNAQAGQLARMQNEDACLTFQDKVSGLFGEVIVEAWNDSLEAYEAVVVEAMQAGVVSLEVSERESVDIPGTEALHECCHRRALHQMVQVPAPGG